MKAGTVDLHCHSMVSDGSTAPADLIGEALAAGLTVLALTDHDSVDGLPEFRKAGAEKGFHCLSGVEISLEYPATMHLLGLDVNDGGSVPESLEALQNYRRARNRLIFQKLKDLGLPVSWERLVEMSGNGQLGRPHFTHHLMEVGAGASYQETFEKYLDKGKPAYVDKKRLEIREGLDILKAAGWAPVLAHPQSLKLEDEAYGPLLKKLKDWGLAGLEVYHPSHSPARSSFFGRLAQKLDLVATAGSDYHGKNKPGLTLSWTPEHSPLGPGILEALSLKLEK